MSRYFCETSTDGKTGKRTKQCIVSDFGSMTLAHCKQMCVIQTPKHCVTKFNKSKQTGVTVLDCRNKLSSSCYNVNASVSIKKNGTCVARLQK